MPTRRERLLRAGLALMGVGATLGVLLDAIHSHFGATSYTNPLVAKTAFWVVPLFAGAYLMGLLRPLFHRGPRPSGRTVALAMGLFIAAYWLTVAPLPWAARSAILLGIFAVGFALCDRTRVGLGIAVTAALVGPAVEAALVRAGAFVHHEALWLGVPGWLPFLYMTAAVGLGSLGSWLCER